MFLKGGQIYLREFRESELNKNYHVWMNDHEVNQYMETRFLPQSEEDIYNYWIEHYQKKDEPWFAICLKETNDHIGNIKLGPIDWIHRNAEISLFIGKKDLWRKGFGAEAINLITDYAFKILNLHKMKAKVYLSNKASEQAFYKCGFRIEGRLNDEVFFDGKYTDLILMGKINE